MSDVMTNLREMAATIPSPKDARDAVRSHLPAVDVDAVVPKARSARTKIAIVVGGLVAVATVFGFARRHRAGA